MPKLSKTTWITLALIPQWLTIKILAQFPAIVEQYYSQGLYPIIAKSFRYAFGWLPFSFGDLMYIILIISIIRELFLLFKNRFCTFKKVLMRLGAVVSIVYFAFHILWGLNYYKLPMHQSLAIEHEYSNEDLILLTEQLIEKSNTLHKKLAVTDSSAVVFAFAKAEIFTSTVTGYEVLQEQFPQLDYPPKSCLLYTSPSPRDLSTSRMPSSA